MGRSKPWRPNNEITQSFNDGWLRVYAVHTESPPGRYPVETLTVKLPYLRYEERSLTVARLYASRYTVNANMVDGQNMANVSRVLRVPRCSITSQDVVRTQDGVGYKVVNVETIMQTYPASMDITLRRIEMDRKNDGMA